MKKYLLILCLITVICLDGCRTYVPIVEQSHNLEVRMRYDSVARDHVRIMYIKGDTIHTTDSVTIVRWKFRTDTITREVKMDVPVEVPPKDYYFCKRCTLGLFLLLGFALLTLGFVFMVKWVKR